MDDIISHGHEREPTRLARPAAAALILAVLIVLAVVAIGRLPRHHIPAPHRPAAVIASGPVQLAGLGSGVARRLNGYRPDHRPERPGGHAHRCSHIQPGKPRFPVDGRSYPPSASRLREWRYCLLADRSGRR